MAKKPAINSFSHVLNKALGFILCASYVGYPYGKPLLDNANLVTIQLQLEEVKDLLRELKK